MAIKLQMNRVFTHQEEKDMKRMLENEITLHSGEYTGLHDFSGIDELEMDLDENEYIDIAQVMLVNGTSEKCLIFLGCGDGEKEIAIMKHVLTYVDKIDHLIFFDHNLTEALVKNIKSFISEYNITNGYISSSYIEIIKCIRDFARISQSVSIYGVQSCFYFENESDIIPFEAFIRAMVKYSESGIVSEEFTHFTFRPTMPNTLADLAFKRLSITEKIEFARNARFHCLVFSTPWLKLFEYWKADFYEKKREINR